jgi:hypothetical protein
MFVLSDKPSYWFRVEVKRPNDATGRWETLDFTGEFKRRSRPEIDEMITKGLPSDDEVLATEFLGWRGVKDASGKELEVTPANRTALLAEPYVKAAVISAWLESAIHGPRKN